MTLPDFLAAAYEAWALLMAYPLHWLAVMVIFLLVVESLMLIPYVGFVIKLAVAGIVVPQVVGMFAGAGRGHAPNPLDMLGAFSFPLSTQAVLAGAALLPFAIGILYLYAKGGKQATAFFFGNIFKAKQPSAALFERFKYLLQFASLPFTLLAGAVVVNGSVGLAALWIAFSAALTHWLPVLLLGLLALAFEWFSAHLPKALPKWAGATLSITLTVVYLAWIFALTYTVSASVFMAQGT